MVRNDNITTIHNDNHNTQYSFSKVVFCNIGNPPAFCAPPVTFHRQVLSCLMYPPLINNQHTGFPKDGQFFYFQNILNIQSKNENIQ